jgi:hypothetical protein
MTAPQPQPIQLIQREWKVLKHLRKHPLCTLRDLSTAQGWKNATMAGLALRRLKTLGLVVSGPLQGTRKLLWTCTPLGDSCDPTVVFQRVTAATIDTRKNNLARGRQKQMQTKQAQRASQRRAADDEDDRFLMPKQLRRAAQDAPRPLTSACSSIFDLGARMGQLLQAETA